ncbi:hypothetical protein AB0H36_06930 [Kribbella sp. NPDC050820]|uniref:hypothetical protein n=1 Tax=Kribbella sp. NPDC050820 TaxID=3155408 RepID=UPI00340CF9CD
MSSPSETWLEVRRYLVSNRYRLGTEAAHDFPAASRVAGTPLLAPASWIPPEPIPLMSVQLEFDPDAVFSGVTGVVPGPYETYAEAMAALAPPAVFENRPTYRLLSADLAGPRPVLRLGRGTYFDSINTGEAAAHEYAARRLGHADPATVRTAIGDPWDPTRRPTNVAISTLTIRRDVSSGESTFYLHWRDPAKVAHAAGLYQVVPSGIFQPSTDELNDFSLWRNIIRELSEELLGASETYNGPIDYTTWPLAAHLTTALADGTARAYCVGLGVDPLTFATDLLTVLSIDSDLFDTLFGDVVATNTEGHVLTPQPLTPETLNTYIHHKPLQSAGAALLQLTLNHRLT